MKRWLLILSSVAVGALTVLTLQQLSPLQGRDAAPAIPRELTSYRDVVKKVLPAVVSVEALAKNGERMRRADDDGRETRVGFGSGFLISPRGVIVTNNHVVEEAEQVQIQMFDGRKFRSNNIRADLKTDLAIIQLEGMEGLPYLEFGDSSTLEIGDRVLAVGAPFGLTGTVTHGIISSKGRSLRMNLYEDFLQTDAAINPGNSGGPLVSLDGRVIGVNSAIKSRSGGFQGIGLAISSNLSRDIVSQLLKDGIVRRGYLGVGILDVDEAIQKELNLERPEGVKVNRIYPDSPGDKAGLKTNDVILAIDGKRLKDSRELQMVVARLTVGKVVDVEIIRAGKPMTLQVTIEEQPTTFGAARLGELPRPGRGAIVVEKVGLTIADLTPELAELLGYPDTVRGALITEIKRNSVAHFAGLVPGKVILRVNRKEVTTARACAEALASGSTRIGISLQVRGPRSGVEQVTLIQQ